MSKIGVACERNVLSANLELNVNGGRPRPFLSTEFTLNWFMNSHWKEIYLNLTDIDLVDIQECGMILFEYYTPYGAR